MSKSPVVAVEGLVKSYGDLRAVVDVNFEVDRGEVFALLGPNGAGKTTTIEILEGFRSRDQGKVQVLGFDPADRRTSRQMREQLGVVLQELAVEPYLSVRRVLMRQAGYFPRPRPVDEVLELVGLGDKSRDRVQDPVGWPAAPPGPRARDHRRPRAAHPRRADDRLRSVRSPGRLGAHPSPGGPGHDGHPHHPLHGRSRGVGLTGGGDQRWTHRC